MENASENKVRKILFNEVSFIVAIFSVVFGCFIYLSQPGSDNETALLLQHNRIETQGTVIDKLTETQQNDIQEVKEEVKGLRIEVGDLAKEIVKLTTIIQERIPSNIK